MSNFYAKIFDLAMFSLNNWVMSKKICRTTKHDTETEKKSNLLYQIKSVHVSCNFIILMLQLDKKYLNLSL